MAAPYFELRQEVHAVRNHLRVVQRTRIADAASGQGQSDPGLWRRFTYRIEDAKGACFNI